MVVPEKTPAPAPAPAPAEALTPSQIEFNKAHGGISLAEVVQELDGKFVKTMRKKEGED